MIVRPSPAALLDLALEVAEDFQGQGLSLTLRQLYYQLVAAQHIPNSQKEYKRLGKVLTDARYQGEFPMDMLEDRGRNTGEHHASTCKLDVDCGEREAAKYMRALPHWSIETDRWYFQPFHVSVWVEKDALSGVFEAPCIELGVPMFPCKGYPSVSSLWKWLQDLQDAYRARPDFTAMEEAVVLYFGDHDPDGWQIPRSAEAGLAQLVLTYDLDVPPISFERIALNMDQIEAHSAPPYPAKVSSARYASYLDEHDTDDAWELDALHPTVLRDLIRSNVDRLFDHDIHEDNQRQVQKQRRALCTRLESPGWVRGALRGDLS